MEVSSSHNTVTINGNIKSVSHYHQIKTEIEKILDKFSDTKSIKIHLLDSIAITSSVIGFFCKLVNIDGVSIHLHVNDESLYDLLNDLNIVTLLNVQKI